MNEPRSRLTFRLKDGREVSGVYDTMELAMLLAGYWDNPLAQSRVQSMKVEDAG